jgi:S-adenosylmethionine synthetase
MDPDTKQEYGLGSFTPDDLTPKAIRDRFGLQKPIYLETARKGHFGNECYEADDRKYFSWDINSHFY